APPSLRPEGYFRERLYARAARKALPVHPRLLPTPGCFRPDRGYPAPRPPSFHLSIGSACARRVPAQREFHSTSPREENARHWDQGVRYLRSGRSAICSPRSRDLHRYRAILHKPSVPLPARSIHMYRHFWPSTRPSTCFTSVFRKDRNNPLHCIIFLPLRGGDPRERPEPARHMRHVVEAHLIGDRAHWKIGILQQFLETLQPRILDFVVNAMTRGIPDAGV